MPETSKAVPEQKIEMVGTFINQWLKFANEHPELTVGDWLYASSLMSGMVLRLGGSTEDEMLAAANKMPLAIEEIYKNAKAYFPDVTIQ